MSIQHFKKLKDKYDRFQNHLLKNGQLLAKDTKIGYWGVTPLREAYEVFNRLNISSYKSFMDIGSGDGRIVLLASLFGMKAHGIEFDDDLVNAALHIRRELDIPLKNTKIIQDNFLDHDLSEYNLIYTSPDKPFHRKGVELKLQRELKGDLLVHGWEFHPQQLKLKEQHVINGEKFCLYTKH